MDVVAAALGCDTPAGRWLQGSTAGRQEDWRRGEEEREDWWRGDAAAERTSGVTVEFPGAVVRATRLET